MYTKEIRVLAKQLEQVVREAAFSTASFVGTGKKNEGDQAAVNAMRKAFDNVDCSGVVQVGEGEKDNAPMLFVGEQLGNGRGLNIDIAADPVEGTNLMAEGLPNAITVLAATQQGGFWNAGSAYYMDKIVVGKEAFGCIDINDSIERNIRSVAKAKNKLLSELKVYVLNKPRHVGLINEIESLGATVCKHPEGDVVGSLLALMPEAGVDILMGIGGAPEAVISAAAVKAMGGDMQGKLAPQKDQERDRLNMEGVDLDYVLNLDDFIKSDWAIFTAAGVTTGLLLKGVGQGMESLIVGPELDEIHFRR